MAVLHRVLFYGFGIREWSRRVPLLRVLSPLANEQDGLVVVGGRQSAGFVDQRSVILSRFVYYTRDEKRERGISPVRWSVAVERCFQIASRGNINKGCSETRGRTRMEGRLV